MMEEGQEGCGGRTEERRSTCGVVWKEAPESAIHSVLTGGVRPMALKDCANRGVAPAAIGCLLKVLAANGAAAGGIPNAGHAAAREAVARAESLGATACAARAAGATACAAAREAAARASCAACAAGATAATKAAAAARSAGATA